MNFGEYLPDIPARDNPGLTVAKNCIPHAKSYKQLSSPVDYSNALTLRCRGAIAAKDKTGNVYNYAADADDLYSLSGTTYSVVTQSAAYHTTADDVNWEFAQWGEKVICVNGYTDTPQIITLGGSNFADLSGGPPQAKHIGIIGGFVVLGNISDGTVYPNKLHWSAIENETGWTVGTNQSDTQELLSGGQIQKVVGGEYGTIICETSIWRMTYVGYPLVFQFDEIESNRGTVSPSSVIKFGSSIFYLDKDGFYMFDGAKSIPIGANKIDKTFYNDFDQNYYDRISVAIDPINTLVFWAYPGFGNSSGLNNKALCYNWSTNTWSGPIEVDTEILTSSLSTGYTLDELTTILGYTNIDTLPYSLDSRFWQGGSTLLSAFNSSHKLVNFTGDALDAVFETGEFNLNQGGRAFVSGVRPLFDGDGTATIQIGSRDTVNGSTTWGASSSQNSRTGLCPARNNAYYHRARMTITGGFSHAYGVEPEFKAVGK